MAKRNNNNNTRRNKSRRGGRRTNTRKNGLFRKVYNIPSAGIHAVRDVTGTGLNLLVNIPTDALKGAKNVIKSVAYKGLNGIDAGAGRVFSGANNVVRGATSVFSRKDRKSRRSRRAGRR